MRLEKVIAIMWLSILIVFLSHILANSLSLNQIYEMFSIQIKDFVLSLGVLGPIVFILIYTLRPLLLFPSTILTIIAGFLFGPIYGILYTIIGENMSGNFAFCLSRFFSFNFEPKKNWIKKVNLKIKENGFMTTLVLRLIWIPFDLVNYGLGLTKIKHKDFFLGTFIGIIPGIIIFVLLGNILASVKTLNKELLILNFELSFLVFIISVFVSYYLKRKNKLLSKIT